MENLAKSALLFHYNDVLGEPLPWLSRLTVQILDYASTKFGMPHESFAQIE